MSTSILIRIYKGIAATSSSAWTEWAMLRPTLDMWITFRSRHECPVRPAEGLMNRWGGEESLSRLVFASTAESGRRGGS